LHKGGSATPIFFAAPILGTLFPYVSLSQILGGTRPIYGLAPRGSEAGEEPFGTIPELAAYCVAGMRTVQPQGPYMVSGWSFGATVAFEVARQLEAQGQTVSLLAPLDLPAPGGVSNGFMDFWRFFGGSMIRNLVSYSRDYLYLQSGRSSRKAGGFMWPLLERAVIARVIPPEARKSFADQPGVRELMKLYKANIAGLSAYRPPLTCQCRIDLFRTSDHNKRRHSEPLGWDKVTLSTTVVHHLPGDHMSILRQPFVASLAAAMEQRIQEIEGAKHQA
jgi:thioesterase domain-containing protein